MRHTHANRNHRGSDTVFSFVWRDRAHSTASSAPTRAFLSLPACRHVQLTRLEWRGAAALCRLANELGMTRPELESLAAIRSVLEKLEQPDVAWVAHGASSCSFTSWENKVLGLLLTTVVDRLEAREIPLRLHGPTALPQPRPQTHGRWRRW